MEIRMKTLVASLGSFVLGLALVLSCSDDSPPDADAAVCDCPVGEAPITSSRIVRETSAPAALAVNGSSIASTACTRGIAISGSCDLDANTAMYLDVQLVEAGMYENNAWVCRWSNKSVQATSGTASVMCLMPAP
jgi:hypothetical protein